MTTLLIISLFSAFFLWAMLWKACRDEKYAAALGINKEVFMLIVFTSILPVGNIGVAFFSIIMNVTYWLPKFVNDSHLPEHLRSKK